MIREMGLEDICKIYKKYIVKDFPGNERRPLSQIKKLYSKNIYTCLGYFDKNKLLAYACFIHHRGRKVVLLDYFAVNKTMRGSGVGSAFMSEIRDNMKVYGVIIECEMPDKAEDDEDRRVREKRIRFYQNNGALLTDIGWRAFGVDYNLLLMPLHKKAVGLDTAKDISLIYSQTLPFWLGKCFLKSYNI